MEQTSDLSDLAKRIVDLARGKRRIIVGIAGPPGAGKTTLAKALERAVNAAILSKENGLKACNIVAKALAMDGFHHDNAKLDEMGLRHRKGAPETFDANGFIALIDDLRFAEKTTAFPGFDRAADAVVPIAGYIDSQVKIILAEGNYLLLKTSPWDQLLPLFDLTIMIKSKMFTLEKRLIERWIEHGLDEEAARRRALENDIVNAKIVLGQSASADVLIG